MDDEYVANLLKKDAKANSIKYSAVGLQALLPKASTSAAPKANTRFLRNLLRETTSHNAALLAQEKNDARARIGGGRAPDSGERGVKRSREHSREKGRDDRRNSKRRREDRKHSYDSEQDRSNKSDKRRRSPRQSREDDDRRKNDRKRRRYRESFDEESRRQRDRRPRETKERRRDSESSRSRSPERSRRHRNDRGVESMRSRRRRDSGESYRSKQERQSRRPNDENDSESSGDDLGRPSKKYKHHRDGNRRTSRTRQWSRCRSRSRSRHRTQDSHSAGGRAGISHASRVIGPSRVDSRSLSADTDRGEASQEEKNRQRRTRRDRAYSPVGRFKITLETREDKEEEHGNRTINVDTDDPITLSTARGTALEREDASDSDPLEAILGPAPPPPEPEVRSRGRGAFTATSGSIDSHFKAGYDPSLDVRPDPDIYDDWDQALEALRDRQRWKQKGMERLRSAGFSEEELKRWETGGEKDESDVRWAKKGEGREWDRGKVVDLDGTVSLKAAWTASEDSLGRLKEDESFGRLV